MSELIRKGFYLTPELEERLRWIAFKTRTKESEIIRKALDAWLKEQEAKDEPDKAPKK